MVDNFRNEIYHVLLDMENNKEKEIDRLAYEIQSKKRDVATIYAEIDFLETKKQSCADLMENRELVKLNTEKEKRQKNIDEYLQLEQVNNEKIALLVKEIQIIKEKLLPKYKG